MQKNITAIVPSYNEADRIGGVLSVLNTYPRFKEIIVVDDGSTDHTQQIVAQFSNVRYVKQKNTGKGGALDAGVGLATTELIFFCDADITGLSRAILDKVCAPVIKNQVGMSIAIQNRKAYFLNYLFVTKVLRLVPVLAGQRLLTKELWEKLPHWYKKNFRIEVGLNFYSKYYGQGYCYQSFRQLGQVVKEKKYGLLKGLFHRIAMATDVLLAQLKLYALEVPATIKSRRIALLGSLGNVVGFGIGLLFVWASYIGPLNALLKIFAERLEHGRAIFFWDFLTRTAATASVEILALMGIVAIVLNFVGFAFNGKRLLSLLNTTK